MWKLRPQRSSSSNPNQWKREAQDQASRLVGRQVVVFAVLVGSCSRASVPLLPGQEAEPVHSESQDTHGSQWRRCDLRETCVYPGTGLCWPCDDIQSAVLCFSSPVSPPCLPFRNVAVGPTARGPWPPLCVRTDGGFVQERCTQCLRVPSSCTAVPPNQSHGL